MSLIQTLPGGLSITWRSLSDPLKVAEEAALLKALAWEAQPCLSRAGQFVHFHPALLREDPGAWLKFFFPEPVRRNTWCIGRWLFWKAYEKKYTAISISHSSEWVVCAAVREGGVGIDLEPPRRTLSKALVQRLWKDAESRFPGVSPLQLWTLQEAGWKASRFLPSPAVSTSRDVLTQIHIHSLKALKFYPQTGASVFEMQADTAETPQGLWSVVVWNF